MVFDGVWESSTWGWVSQEEGLTDDFRVPRHGLELFVLDLLRDEHKQHCTHRTMSKIPPASQKKRKLEDGMRGKTARPKKRIRKQQDYHSSEDESDASDTGFAQVDLKDPVEERTGSNAEVLGERLRKPTQQSEDHSLVERSSSSDEEDLDREEEGEEDEDDSDTVHHRKQKPTKKRNDPEAFSTSMAKILSTKLPQSARNDPVLSRSRDAVQTTSSMANERLERKAKAKLRAEKREEMERGRIKDVLGFESGTTGEAVEEEKRLRKVAQRGVVKLFNAVRAAQVQADRAAKTEQKKGTVGIANREERVKEMSKQGFLDLISGNKKDRVIEET